MVSSSILSVNNRQAVRLVDTNQVDKHVRAYARRRADRAATPRRWNSAKSISSRSMMKARTSKRQPMATLGHSMTTPRRQAAIDVVQLRIALASNLARFHQQRFTRPRTLRADRDH